MRRLIAQILSELGRRFKAESRAEELLKRFHYFCVRAGGRPERGRGEVSCIFPASASIEVSGARGSLMPTGEAYAVLQVHARRPEHRPMLFSAETEKISIWGTGEVTTSTLEFNISKEVKPLSEGLRLSIRGRPIKITFKPVDAEGKWLQVRISHA